MDITTLTNIMQAQSQQIAQMQEEAAKRDEAYNALAAKFTKANISGPNLLPSNQKSTSKAKGKGKHSQSTPLPSNHMPVSKVKGKTPQVLTPKMPLNKISPATKASKSSPVVTSSPKHDPNQLVVKETPAEFKSTKEALYCFIKIIWRMVESGAVPPPPDPGNTQEFSAAFSSTQQIDN
ncbi:hypothetical protein CROQUDRAFT_91656, partial [Cronartium quercuum f. sp. fusiforme G11]